MSWLLAALAATVTLYGLALLAFVVAGRRTQARALAGFVPDCAVLLARLGRSGDLSRRERALLVGVLAYLAMPFDLVPDFLPIAGQLDDAVLVALVLRRTLRAAGADRVQAAWPGPPAGLAVVLRLAGLAQAG